ncbi:MAG: hypothetical protein WCJ02_10775 [bacterium]
MEPELIDLLIVGGPPLNYGRFKIKVRQVPFTFEGINEAFRLLPECNHLVVMPGQDIFDSPLVANNFEWAYENSGVDQCLLKLGLFSIKSNDPIPDQISNILKDIQGMDHSLFTRRVACAFFAHLCEGMYNIVENGGSVYVLMPEDYPSWDKNDKTFMVHAMPGIDITTTSKWSRRVRGEFSSILDGNPSKLLFSFEPTYLEKYSEDYFSGNSGELDTPHRILRLLPEPTTVRWKVGAVDRANGWRVLVLIWGSGKLIFAPALSWTSVLKELGVDGFDGSETQKIECSTVDAGCTDQKLSVPARGSLANKLPTSKDEITRWNEILGWAGTDGRRGAIRSIEDLAWTLDMLPKEMLKSNKKVDVYSIDGSISRAKTTGEALRKTISRLKAKQGLPESLISLLDEADKSWKNHFHHS